MHAEGGTYTRQPGGQSTSAGAATPFAAAGIFLDTCPLRLTEDHTFSTIKRNGKAALQQCQLAGKVCGGLLCKSLPFTPVCGEGRGSH